MLAKCSISVVRFENPRLYETFSRLQDFARVQAFEEGAGFPVGALGCPELTGRDIGECDSRASAVQEQCSEIAVLPGTQKVRRGYGAGSDDSREVAPHEFLARTCRFHLIAKRYAIALLDQARD